MSTSNTYPKKILQIHTFKSFQKISLQQNISVNTFGVGIFSRF